MPSQEMSTLGLRIAGKSLSYSDDSQLQKRENCRELNQYKSELLPKPSKAILFTQIFPKLLLEIFKRSPAVVVIPLLFKSPYPLNTPKLIQASNYNETHEYEKHDKENYKDL